LNKALAITINFLGEWQRVCYSSARSMWPANRKEHPAKTKKIIENEEWQHRIASDNITKHGECRFSVQNPMSSPFESAFSHEFYHYCT